MLAAGGLVAGLKNPANPNPEDLFAGRTGKRKTLYHTVGMVSFVGGGLTFLGTARCSSFSWQTVRELEAEGQRRGFAPPAAGAMTMREWVARVAAARADTAIGKWMTIVGSATMLAAGSAMRDYQPHPDQRGARRLGPGIGFFLAGFGSTVIGTAVWASSAADVRSLERRQPGPGTTITVGPMSRGLRVATVVRF